MLGVEKATLAPVGADFVKREQGESSRRYTASGQRETTPLCSTAQLERQKLVSKRQVKLRLLVHLPLSATDKGNKRSSHSTGLNTRQPELACQRTCHLAGSDVLTPSRSLLNRRVAASITLSFNFSMLFSASFSLASCPNIESVLSSNNIDVPRLEPTTVLTELKLAATMLTYSISAPLIVPRLHRRSTKVALTYRVRVRSRNVFLHPHSLMLTRITQHIDDKALLALWETASIVLSRGFLWLAGSDDAA